MAALSRSPTSAYAEVVEWRNLIVEWRNWGSWNGGMKQQSGVICPSGPPYIHIALMICPHDQRLLGCARTVQFSLIRSKSSVVDPWCCRHLSVMSEANKVEIKSPFLCLEKFTTLSLHSAVQYTRELYNFVLKGRGPPPPPPPHTLSKVRGHAPPPPPLPPLFRHDCL